MSLPRYDGIKRGVDVILSSVGLVLTAPLQIGVAVLVRVKLGAPVIFRQQRPGANAKVFTLYKFRTMLPPDPERGRVSDAARLTPLGAFLRSTSLDELPSLWNVLRGDMSLVGPRPLRTYYLPLYTPEQARRHEVRPGITGLAQVTGRNELPWEDRFRLDVTYVDNRSITLDLSILLQTVFRVLRRSGTTAPGHVTMPPFTGSAGTDND
ncbi:sugar transferase [Georgenia sp. H159]|uniref:sugar transferase n=1 Tax=Georgenia sp. H159 TaxID=3076115 RepID=UPI002D77F257|nr:sugar transferase [Georgenia sp. H159]